mgnify:CR=1 FL=1
MALYSTKSLSIKKLYTMKKILLLAMLAMYLSTGQAKKNAIPVFITAGQSNTDGRVKNEFLPEYIKQNKYHHTYWCYNNGQYSEHGEFSLFWPHIDRKDAWDRWTYDAVTYYFLDRSMGCDYYVIKESRGGTAISLKCKSDHSMYWNASPQFLKENTATDKGGKSLLKALCENIDLAIDKSLSPKGDYDIKALIWHQGESDRHDDKAYYQNLKEMIAYVRHHLVKKTGKKKYYKLPVILGGIAHKSAGFSEGVEEGQRRLAKEDRNVHFIPVPDATLQSDWMHFDADGAELLGKKIYNKLVELKLAGKGAKEI